MKTIRITLKEDEGYLITVSKKKNDSLIFFSEKGKTIAGTRKEEPRR